VSLLDRLTAPGAWRRWFPPAALAVIAVLTFALYVSKTQAGETRRRVEALREQVENTRADVSALEAEVARLESPARIERLAREQLDLEPGAAARAAPISELDAALPAPEAAPAP
jgi:cell division protein FtsL